MELFECDPYKDWISLYDDEIKTIWGEEKAELRRVSMIYYALHKEFNRIKNTVSKEIDELKSTLKKRDYLLKCKRFKKLAQSEPFDVLSQKTEKENVVMSGIVPLRELHLNNTNNSEGLDIFEKPPLAADSPEPSDPDVTQISPKMNRGRLSYAKKSLSPSLLYPVIPHKIEKAPEPDETKLIKEAGTKQKIENTPKLMDRIAERINNKTPLMFEEAANIMESSIVDNTPDVKPPKTLRGNKISLLRSKKKNVSKKQATLTQMLSQPGKKKKFDSNMASMDIDEILDYININRSTSEVESSSKSDDSGTANSTDKETDKFKVPLSFIKTYDMLPERKDTAPKYAYEEVVRGHERKKLKGWSCKECEQFYKGMDLPPLELEKKMDECSKHRGKCRPRDETHPGFWDLTFGPTPRTPETEESMVFNYRK